MPYGNFNEPDFTAIINCQDSRYSFPTVRTYTQVGWYLMSRTGSDNNTSVRGKELPKKKGPFKKVLVTSKDGPRVPQRVYNPKTGRYSYVRRKVKQYRYEQGPTESRPSKGMDLQPNDLNFSECKSQRLAEATYTSCVNPLWSFTVSYSGDLFARFKLLYGNNNYFGTTSYPRGGSPSSRFEVVATELSSIMITKLYEKVKNQNVNIAQAIAERAQTFGMIGEALVRAARSIHDIRRGNVRKAASNLFPSSQKELARDWLTYQYGVRPLLSDIEGMIKQVSEEGDLYYDIKVKKRVRLDSVTLYDYTHTYYFSGRETIISSGFVDVVYKTRIKVNSPTADFLKQIGFTNVASLAWEVIPYSFVLDWFIPIGGFLNNLDAFTGLDHVYTTKTTFIKERILRTKVIGGTDHSGATWSPAADMILEERTKCVRQVLETPPTLPFPDFKDPVSSLHIANAIALLKSKSFR